MSTIESANGPVQGTPGETARGPLDRILGVFTEVKGGEGVTAILLMLNIFLLLAAYSMLKTIREPLILTVPGGAEVKSYAAAAIAGLFMILVPLYSALASRVSRVKLVNGVTLFFAACLVAFFVLQQAGVPIGVAFFIWVGIFNISLVAQFWSFANEIYSQQAGDRLFPIIGALVAGTAQPSGVRLLDDQNVWVYRMRVHRDIVP